MMDAAERDLRERLAQIGRTLFSEGLTHGTSGNISARISGSDKCLIKPSGYCLGDLKPESFLIVDNGTRGVLEGNGVPSIETPFHTALYNLRPEVGGVVHLHPHYSVILSITGSEIIPMNMDVYDAPALARGIAISEFAPPGSEKLAENLAEALRQGVAALMPHHGITTVGKTPEEAAQNARVTERLAKVQYETSQVGDPKALPEAVLSELVELAVRKGLLI